MISFKDLNAIRIKAKNYTFQIILDSVKQKKKEKAHRIIIIIIVIRKEVKINKFLFKKMMKITQH